KSDVFADNIRETPQGLRFTVTTNSLRFDADLNVIGRHNINDALAAISAAVYFGLSEREIIEGLASFRNVGMRQNIYRKSGMTIIEDCYNASPESVLAAMQVLKGISTEGRRFLILGGMRELGDYAQKGHFDCGREAAAAADFLYVFGENAEYYIEGAKKAGMNTERIRRFATKSELAKTLAQTALPGDVLLIKGSRAMKMEEVTEFLFGEIKNEV
ncbi:MAG: cyanophycin synthetase, partial [Bacillota bacterium]|nr:cyanophycin synthetase [Bacillota bacterium]